MVKSAKSTHSNKKSLNHTSGITLQQRPLKDGRVSLYLHVHRKGCKAERVWLKLYLTGNKFADKRTLTIADEARRQKHLELQMSDFAQPNANDELIAFMLHRSTLRRNPKSYNNTIRQLKLFTGKETIGFEEVTRAFADDFAAPDNQNETLSKQRGNVLASAQCRAERSGA